MEDLDLLVSKSSKDEKIEGLCKILSACGLAAGPLQKRLVIVDNTTFTFLCETATEITTKVSLEFQTKTAKQGFLRSEESVPPEALFCGLAMIQAMHTGDAKRAAGHIDELEGQVLQFGAKASTGAGLCRLGVLGGAE